MQPRGTEFAIPLEDGTTLASELFLPTSPVAEPLSRASSSQRTASRVESSSQAEPGRSAQPPYPGVLVLHESFGLNDDIRRIASRFASEGYAALAPNLFSHGSRIVCLTRVVSDVVKGNAGREVADILAARRALADRADVDADRIAVAGFCLGGGFALLAAAEPGFRAASVNYGDVPKDRAKLDKVCPVVGSFGGRDRLFGRNMAERLEAHLAALGVARDVKVYDQAGHSFFSQHEGWQAALARLPTPMAVGPDQGAADDGWERILRFFDEHVRSPSEIDDRRVR